MYLTSHHELANKQTKQQAFDIILHKLTDFFAKRREGDAEAAQVVVAFKVRTHFACTTLTHTHTHTHTLTHTLTHTHTHTHSHTHSRTRGPAACSCVVEGEADALVVLAAHPLVPARVRAIVG